MRAFYDFPIRSKLMHLIVLKKPRRYEDLTPASADMQYANVNRLAAIK